MLRLTSAPSAARLSRAHTGLTGSQGRALYLTHQPSPEARSAHLRRYHITAGNGSLLPSAAISQRLRGADKP